MGPRAGQRALHLWVALGPAAAPNDLPDPQLQQPR